MLAKWDLLKDIERNVECGNTWPFLRPNWDDSRAHVMNWAPPVNVYEEKEALVVDAQLPGIDLNDVTVSVTDHTLQLRGERKVEREDRQDNYHLREAHYGSFARSFRLPAYVDPAQATAVYDKGVLRVVVPKLEKAQPKSIPIDVKG